MSKRFWSWLLLVVGGVGLIMSIISIIIYGIHTPEEIHAIAAYGLLGLAIFSTGLEFRRMSTQSR